MTAFFTSIIELYTTGFRSMVLGRKLWKIILFKIVIIFGVIKVFFFPNVLATNYATDQARASHVLSALTHTSPQTTLHP